MQYGLEVVLKGIGEFRDKLNKLKTDENKDYVEFIDVTLEWLEDLFGVKRWERIRMFPSQWNDVKPLLFPRTIQLIKKKQPLPDVLFDETTKLLNKIIEIGKVEMVDFNLLQFNLARIFGKNVDAIIEQVRQTLEAKLSKLGEEKLLKGKEKETMEEAEMQRIASMPEQELRRFIVSQMFDFTPSAQTMEERMEALKGNRKKVAAQKEKFRDFAIKLYEATANARAGAKTRVSMKTGDVKDEVVMVSEKFREKAREFVSEEGFKRDVQEARKRIDKGAVSVSGQMERVRKDFREKARELISEEGFRGRVEDSRRMLIRKKGKLHAAMAEERKLVKSKGAGWKEHFKNETGKARGLMLERKKELQLHEKSRSKIIKSKGEAETSRATRMMLKGKERFSGHVDYRRKNIKAKGDEEIAGAAEMMLKGKKDFSDEVGNARKLFADTGNEIEESRKEIKKGRIEFSGKKGDAKERFGRRAGEVKGLMSSIMHKKGEELKGKRDGAKQKFLQHAREVKEGGSGKMGKMKEGMKRFHEKKGEFKAKGRVLKRRTTPSEKTTAAGSEGKRLIEGGLAIMEKAKTARKEMKKKMIHNRNLVELDVRFAQHALKKAANTFMERTEEKNEEFKHRQQTLMARYKSRQKAHMIQSLLRTIRSMR